jgi:hypothetical protein
MEEEPENDVFEEEEGEDIEVEFEEEEFNDGHSSDFE